MILGAFFRLSFCLSARISAAPRRKYFREISHCGLLCKSVEKNPYLVEIENKKHGHFTRRPTYVLLLSAILNRQKALFSTEIVSGCCASVHSVCLSANISAAPTERIYVKSDIGDFHENMSRNSKFGYKRAIISGTWHDGQGKFYFCRRCEIAIKAPFSSEMVSGCYDSRGGTNITRTRHNVILHVHCLSCSRCVLHVSLKG